MIDPMTPDYANTPVSPQRPVYEYCPEDLQAPPCVTIVTPFYNTGPIFHETARSVMQQSLQQWEWCIVNDGSTDREALTVLDKYRQSDPRIRIIDQESNRGPAAARNTGFRCARASYVAQLDSDDLLEPTALEKWLWFLESYPACAFVSGYSVGFGAQQYLWQEGFHRGVAFLEENLVDTNTMIRKAVHQEVGGYDETMQGGMEDWEFWLRCANCGYWGGTTPEYLDWYRRRAAHNDRWVDWDSGERQRSVQAALRRTYPQLWRGGFPQSPLPWLAPNTPVPTGFPCDNRLRKTKPRLLMIVPWLTVGGADKFNLDAIAQLTQRGWEVTIATTLKGEHAWFPVFARSTPDIFILPHFLRLPDYPRFLCYLIRSRQIETVMVTNSEIGYLLLPYLRSHLPDVTFIDFCHMEEEQWKNGGYPGMATRYQEFLDCNIVASAHLKQWMVNRHADARRIAVCHINVDPEHWRPANPEQRGRVRRSLHLGGTTPVILYVGRICAQKQPRVFAGTMELLAQQHRDFAALVAGDGPDLEWLRAFVKRRGLTARVQLLGAVPNERIRELLAAADIFFLPSQWEGIALSIYEAMACGLPIVGADVGGQRELVTAECGMLIARSDETTEAKRYAEALATLLQDHQRRTKMGQAGRQRIETAFRLEMMGDRLAALVHEANRSHQEHPWTFSPVNVGQVCADQAVEYMRLSEVADGLWQERGPHEGGVFHPSLLDPHNDSWRTLAYFAIRRLLLPSYRAVLDRKAPWMLMLKDRLKRALLRAD